MNLSYPFFNQSIFLATAGYAESLKTGDRLFIHESIEITVKSFVHHTLWDIFSRDVVVVSKILSGDYPVSSNTFWKVLSWSWI